MEQAFAYHHMVPADAWMVRVIGSGPGIPWRPIEQPVKLHAGAATPVRLFVPPRLLNSIQFVLNRPPEGISIEEIQPAANGVSVTLRVEAGKSRPGLKGNLILDAFREIASTRRRQPLGTVPAIPFEIVEPVTGKD
jgi:hypothetical protein